MRFTGWPLGFACLLLNCGEAESARAECEALKAAYCKTALSCVPPEPAPTYEQIRDYCARRFDSAINCAEAGSVSSSYDRCLSEVSALACPEPVGLTDPTVALPRSCIGVIRMR